MKEVMNGKRVCFTVLEEVLSMRSNVLLERFKIRAILVLITRNLKWFEAETVLFSSW